MNRPIQRAAAFLQKNLPVIPQTLIVLGSGLSDFAEMLSEPVRIPYSAIPHFPVPTVPGHPGVLFCGTLHRLPVLIMQGRVHVYEGHPVSDIVFPIRLFQTLGVRNLLLTNAAGGIAPRLQPGSLMLLSDHLSFFGPNPLIGTHDTDNGQRFPDMSRVYDPLFRTTLLNLAAANRIPLTEGVYAWATGPSFETPAEAQLLYRLGADAVGMSTVPEAIVARQAHMRVAALSCITNRAAALPPDSGSRTGAGAAAGSAPASGPASHPLSHDEVLKAVGQAQSALRLLLSEWVRSLADTPGGTGTL